MYKIKLKKMAKEVRILTKKLEYEKYPIMGNTALRLWEITSDAYWGLPVRSAIKLMEKLGYIPFQGYPLKRGNKNESMRLV